MKTILFLLLFLLFSMFIFSDHSFNYVERNFNFKNDSLLTLNYRNMKWIVLDRVSNFTLSGDTVKLKIVFQNDESFYMYGLNMNLYKNKCSVNFSFAHDVGEGEYKDFKFQNPVLYIQPNSQFSDSLKLYMNMDIYMESSNRGNSNPKINKDLLRDNYYFIGYYILNKERN